LIEIFDRQFKALSKLPAGQRVVLVLIDIEKLAEVETSQTLGIDRRTVRDRAKQARARIAELLGDSEFRP